MWYFYYYIQIEWFFFFSKLFKCNGPTVKGTNPKCEVQWFFSEHTTQPPPRWRRNIIHTSEISPPESLLPVIIPLSPTASPKAILLISNILNVFCQMCLSKLLLNIWVTGTVLYVSSGAHMYTFLLGSYTTVYFTRVKRHTRVAWMDPETQFSKTAELIYSHRRVRVVSHSLNTWLGWSF